LTEIVKTPSPAAINLGWLRIMLWLVGVGSILNGAAMYLVPGDWFVAVPGVTETGSFNGHFVRDVGAAYVASGAAVILALRMPVAQFPLLVVTSIFSAGHALRHVIEWLTVEAAHHHLLADGSAVVVPAVIVVYATGLSWRNYARTGSKQEASI